jgi:hypothetical protein
MYRSIKRIGQSRHSNMFFMSESQQRERAGSRGISKATETGMASR